MKRVAFTVLACLVLGCSSSEELVFGSLAADSSPSEAATLEGGDAAKSDAQEGAIKSTDGSSEAKPDTIGIDVAIDAQLDAGETDVTADHPAESSADVGDSAAIKDAAFDAREYGTGACPSAGGEMVRTPIGFCIDKTEVMKDEYLAWLGSKPQNVEQPSECAWNTSFAQDDFCRQQVRYPVPVNSCPADRYAITCIDWCDARAFCAEHGKRLCGGIAGMPITPADALSHSKSEWMAACTSGGKYEYQWGNDPNASNNCDLGGRLLCNGGFCHSPDQAYSAILAMPSDALEWEDACTEDGCAMEGDAFGSMKCNLLNIPSIGTRQAVLPELGFRCCAD